jgi:hypothetical protein
MIVWFNCKISDIRPNPQPRYNLRHDDRFDIAKYSFASFAPLSPLVSKFIFNLEMADAYVGREADMEAWLKSVLPADKLELNWFRCDTKEQWEDLRNQVNELDDDLIFPAGNEDHVFMDSSITVIEELLELIKNDYFIYSTSLISLTGFGNLSGLKTNLLPTKNSFNDVTLKGYFLILIHTNSHIFSMFWLVSFC